MWYLTNKGILFDASNMPFSCMLSRVSLDRPGLDGAIPLSHFPDSLQEVTSRCFPATCKDLVHKRTIYLVYRPNTKRCLRLVCKVCKGSF